MTWLSGLRPLQKPLVGCDHKVKCLRADLASYLSRVALLLLGTFLSSCQRITWLSSAWLRKICHPMARVAERLSFTVMCHQYSHTRP